ncbi:MAG TPA: hypothetical protein VNY05_33405 [Candidatus Acidoferrales bacterium]|nr:hypothetical protein [Candidatus Acidoferrales bacterium]
MNAIRSGIHADSAIIIGEDPEALAQLAETFYHDHQPQTAIERTLLDNIIRDSWLLTRLFRIDAEIIDYEIEDATYKKEDNQAGRAFKDSSVDQSRLQRRINDTRRGQIQAFKEFQRIQAERRAQPAPQPQPPAPPLDVTAVPPAPPDRIGFVPQTQPPAPETEPIASQPPPANGILPPASVSNPPSHDRTAAPPLRLRPTLILQALRPKSAGIPRA